jgi:hypothetical protein
MPKQPTAAQKAEAARAKSLALPVLTNRARLEGSVTNYTIAPRNNIQAGAIQRQPGQASEAAFRRLKMKHQQKNRTR